MIGVEIIIKEKEEKLRLQRESILLAREQYVTDKEQLLELKEKLLENKRLELEVDKQSDGKDPIEIAKSMLAEMSKELIAELKEKETAYKQQVDRDFEQRLIEMETEICEREKSKYERALEKLREENQQLHRQLMSAKIGV